MSAVFSGLIPPPAAAGDDLVNDTTTQAFIADVIEASRSVPVLVDFWAPWCGPCRQLSPVLEKAVRAAKGAVRLVKMNIDEHPPIAGQLGIQSIPAVIAFVERPAGRRLRRRAAGEPGQGLRRPRRRACRPVASAEALRRGGRRRSPPATAPAPATASAACCRPSPENIPALGGLARAACRAGELERARETLAGLPPAAAKDAAIVAVRAAARSRGADRRLGDPPPLEATSPPTRTTTRRASTSRSRCNGRGRPRRRGRPAP